MTSLERSWPAVLFWLSGLGCHAQRPLELELEDAKTVLLLAHVGDGSPGPTPFAIAEVFEGRPRTFASGEDTVLTIYAYDRSPAEVGLPVGPLELARPSAPRKALPRPDRLLGGPPDAVVPLVEPPIEIAAIRVPNRDPGPTFPSALEIVLVESRGHVRMMAPFGADAAIAVVGYFDEPDDPDPQPEEWRWYRVTADGAELLAMTGTVANAVAAGPGESVWIAGRQGGLRRYGREAPNEPYRVLERRSLPAGREDNPVAQQLSLPPDFSEIWALTASAAVVRDQGRGFEVIDRYPIFPGMYPSGVFAVEPGHAFAVFWSDIVEYRGNVRTIAAPPGDRRSYQKITVVPGLGYVLASEIDGKGVFFLGGDGVPFAPLPVEGDLVEAFKYNTPEMVIPFAGGLQVAADRGQSWFLRAHEVDQDGVEHPPFGLGAVIPVDPGNYYNVVQIGPDKVLVGGRQAENHPGAGTPASVYLITAE